MATVYKRYSVRHHTVPYCTLQYRTVLYRTVRHSTVLQHYRNGTLPLQCCYPTVTLMLDYHRLMLTIWVMLKDYTLILAYKLLMTHLGCSRTVSASSFRTAWTCPLGMSHSWYRSDNGAVRGRRVSGGPALVLDERPFYFCNQSYY
jgi:hypothetical protein